jgi:large repetitive protein
MRTLIPILLLPALVACQSTWEIVDTIPLGSDCTFYADADSDGFGDATQTQELDCEAPPAGWVEDATDCDDQDASINPDADEACNGLDDNCDDEVDEGLEGTWYDDADGDGYGDPDTELTSCDPDAGWVEDGTDCDDAIASVNPGAEEACNEVDDDCDGDVDEGLEASWYQDDDGDGYGDPATEQVSCDPGEGWVQDSTDCDDDDIDVNPAATELCNGIDDDCDGAVDDADSDVSDASSWYRDDDADGYGQDDAVVEACEQPIGFAAYGGDCDDADTQYNPGATEDDCDDPNDYNCDGSVSYADSDGDGWAACNECDDGDAAVNPDATELCNSVDDDCDGSIDEDDAADAATWYADTDTDGYGDAATSTDACAQPSGHLADDTDCDDTDAAVNPGATELCNDVDDDCDGTIDEDDAADAATWYADTDVDGYGDVASSTDACEAPSGYVASSTDCDDTDAAVNPSATELCNSVDDDCDGSIDEDDAADAATWYADTDGDGYGETATSDVACNQPTGYVADPGDCDDGDSAVNPSATELCNGVDDDCDGTIDEDDAADATTWYADADADGYGDATTTTDACSQPSGHVADDTDCDDTDAAVNPSATELCNGVDDDCDGDADEDDAADVTTWYADDDDDGYGDAASTTDACSQPSGYVADDTDCDDLVAATNPAASELCDGVDNDCDGTLDEDDATDAATWYADADGDGFGDTATSTDACSQPSGYVADDSDCDDDAAAVSPSATELCNGVDDDCDGTVDEDDAADATTWYADTDADGFGDTASSTDACSQPSGYVAVTGPADTDCDDTDGAVNPSATELCNGVDDDCDGDTDEDDAADVTTWYADADTDGYGDAATSTDACDAPSGYVASSTDCDDLDTAINPDASELCDGSDNDCDGATDEDDATDATTWYIDVDVDGYGAAAVSTTACSQPSGYVADSTDCDDDDASIHPGAAESCDDVDEDCDGLADADDPDTVGGTSWYVDADLDGYGDAAGSITACSEPSGYVDDDSDCDDSEIDINPDATEVCNGVDDDCDGTADSSSVCPCNFERDSGHLYLFCETASDWWDSRDECLLYDSYDLVTVDDATEGAWIQSTAQGYATDLWWWTGYNNQGASSGDEPGGAWEWADGSSSTYTNWATDQPDDYDGIEDCAHIYGDSGAWNDMDCDEHNWYGSKLYYICESS